MQEQVDLKIYNTKLNKENLNLNSYKLLINNNSENIDKMHSAMLH